MAAPLLALEADVPALAGPDRDELFGRVAEMLPEVRLSNETTVARRFDLPFYGDVTLIEMTDPQWRPADTRLCFLDHDGDLSRLEGTSLPIHAINDKADIRINRDTVLHYVAFFCFFVRGEDGPFLVIDRMENRFIQSPILSDPIAARFRPPAIFGQDPDGDWRVSTLISYGNAAFLAHFIVEPSGMIEMLNDVAMTEPLNGQVVAPLNVEYSVSG